MNLRFQVEVNGELREVELVFGTDHDLAALTRWRSGPRLLENPHLRDALEFCRLAAKRWRYYRRAGIAVTSLAGLRALIRRDPSGEFGILLLVKPTWRASAPYLGFCYARRSWCHHLIVDFLGTHPKVIGSVRERIRGVGTGIIHALVRLADDLDIHCIWGEATVNSAKFYERTLGISPIPDHFFVEGAVIDHCRRELRKTHKPKLASPVRK